MITRFYVDNYKCLVNFEYKPKPFELIIGANGSGKTTMFEALKALREFVVFGVNATECFPSSSLTRWQTREEQSFYIECVVPGTQKENNPQVFSYQLLVKHDRIRKTARVVSETLMTSQSALLDFQEDYAVLFKDDYSQSASFPADSARSLLNTIPERPSNRRLTSFRHFLRDLLITRINPMAMNYASDNETSEAQPDFSNFASWYRHHSQEMPEVLPLLNSDLRHILDEFSTLQLTKTGSDRRELMFKTVGSKDAPSYRFDELSDGQRALVVLYSVAHFVVGQGKTVCIDEPENYLSLRELQPLLLTLREKQEENGGQVLLISHHPEFINMLAPQEAVLFERQDGAHTRIKPFSMNGVEAITPAELVARGWESDGE